MIEHYSIGWCIHHSCKLLNGPSICPIGRGVQTPMFALCLHFYMDHHFHSDDNWIEITSSGFISGFGFIISAKTMW